MKRVLKPNGYFIIQEQFCDSEQSAAQQNDIRQHHWGVKIDNLFNIPHRNTFRKKEIKKLFT